MAVKTVPIRESLERSWTIFKNNPLFLVVLFVVVSMVYGIIGKADEMADRFIWPAGLLVRVGYIVALAIVELGVVSVALKLVDHGKAVFDDLFSQFGVFFKFLITFILYSAMVGVGLVFLIVPGVYLAIKFGFFGFAIIDDELEPLDALRASSRLTDGVKLDLFMFYLAVALVLFAGLILLVVGVYIAWPVTQVAIAHVYRDLKSQTGEASAAGAPGRA
ncbi:MAG: hypothetical protein P8181_14190 [bacterium]